MKFVIVATLLALVLLQTTTTEACTGPAGKKCPSAPKDSSITCTTTASDTPNAAFPDCCPIVSCVG